MILFTDGGSTKCDWVLINKKKQIVFQTRTKGLNPAILSEHELQTIIKENLQLQSIFNQSLKIDFYGAGCGTTRPKQLLKKVLENLFPLAQVSVFEDTLAAVRSVTNTKSIVCILGTGSNSCYFDGKNIHFCFESLGFSVMDDASGNYFGKQLLRDYFFKNMPNNIKKQFEATFNLEADFIKNNLYKQEKPNVYLASFVTFIFNSKDQDNYFNSLLKKGFLEFIKNYILCYKNAKEVPIHFIGSIVHFALETLKECLQEHHLKLGKVERKPIIGLTNYYTNKLDS
ncbi:MAG: N-acetylglucosamine kinase [Flavobacteriales bacterium]